MVDIQSAKAEIRRRKKKEDRKKKPQDKNIMAPYYIRLPKIAFGVVFVAFCA